MTNYKLTVNKDGSVVQELDYVVVGFSECYEDRRGRLRWRKVKPTLRQIAELGLPPITP